jgi:predicted metalloprotease with PDZ domain
MITAQDQGVAKRVEAGLQGLLALAWLHVDAAPQLQQLVDQVQVTQDGKVVRCEFRASVDKVVAAMPTARELIRWHRPDDMAGATASLAKKKEATQKRKQKKLAITDAESADRRPQDEPTQSRSTEERGTPVLGVVIGQPIGAEAASVVRVWHDSPADKAGLKPGDRVVEFEGRQIDSPEDLRQAVLRHKPGDEVSLMIRRGDQEKELSVRLGGGDEFAGRFRPRGLHRLLSPRPWLGIHVSATLDRGVSIAHVVPRSPADFAGLKAGDAILRVDKTRVEAPADLQAAIASYRPGETVRLVVLHDDSSETVKVELGAFGIWEGANEEQTRQLFRRLWEGRWPFSEDLQIRPRGQYDPRREPSGESR